MGNTKSMNLNKKRRTTAFLALATISSIVYVIWRLFFTLPFQYGTFAVIMGIALLFSEASGVVESFIHYRNTKKVKIPEMPKIKAHMYPDVDILIATHNESEELLYKTINGCLHMKYPDKKKVHIYICDDNDRSSMRELAESMGVGYFGLANNTLAKAGNLNNALRQTSSPLVVTFDADMIPTSRFLMETVPYFSLPVMVKDSSGWRERTPDEIDPNDKIGFIQTPQSFYNEDLFQSNLYNGDRIPNEQDLFFRKINVGSTRTNTVIYAGSNTVISREALEEVGYIATGSITEDFATGINIQAAGYRSIAIDKELAHGLAPSDFKSLIKQRQRWARGCIQLMTSSKFWFGPLPFRNKLHYVITVLYWWGFTRRLIYILCPILFVLFGVVTVDSGITGLLLIWLPYYTLYSGAIRIMSANLRSNRHSAIFDVIIFPYLILPVIAETFKIKMKKFWVTPKDTVTQKNASMKYAIPHIILSVLSIVAIGLSLGSLFSWNSYGSLFMIGWLCFNLYTLLNAIVFFVGRTNYRRDERIYASVPVTLHPGENKFQGITSDLSENGLAVLLDAPEYLPIHTSFPISIRYKGYGATVYAEVLHVHRQGEKWKYSFKILEMSEEDRRAYYQIIYDRDHTFPKTASGSLLDDIKSLAKGLRSRPQYTKRTLPEIKLDLPLNTKEDGVVEAVSFDYKKFTLKNSRELPDKLTLELDQDYAVECEKKEGTVSSNADGVIEYQVIAWRLLAEDPTFRKLLFKKIGISDRSDDYYNTNKQTELPAFSAV